MSESGGWRKRFESFFSWGWRFGPGPVPAEAAERPLTPAHVFALRHYVRTQRQFFIGVMAAFATFILLLPITPIWTPSNQLGPVFVIAGCLGLFCLLSDWLGFRRGHEAELRQGVYYRASGPVRVYSGRDNGRVEVGDLKIHHVSSTICVKLRDLPFGYVDYAPRSRLVVEQRDADGELVYRYPAYDPDGDPTIVLRLPSLLTPIVWGAGVALICAVGLIAVSYVMAI